MPYLPMLTDYLKTLKNIRKETQSFNFFHKILIFPAFVATTLDATIPIKQRQATSISLCFHHYIWSIFSFISASSNFKICETGVYSQEFARFCLHTTNTTKVLTLQFQLYRLKKRLEFPLVLPRNFTYLSSCSPPSTHRGAGCSSCKV